MSSRSAKSASNTDGNRASEMQRRHDDKVVAVSKASERAKQVGGFTLWTAAPLLLTAGITVFGTVASIDPTAAPVLRPKASLCPIRRSRSACLSTCVSCQADLVKLRQPAHRMSPWLEASA